MPTSLTGTSPANTFERLLHLDENGIVRLGDGTLTPLWLTGPLTVVLAGNVIVEGDLTVKGGFVGIGAAKGSRLTTDVTATTNTPIPLTELNIDLLDITAVYSVKLALIATSTATTTGVQITNTNSAGQMELVLAEQGTTLGISAAGGTYAATSAPSAGAPFGILLHGIMKNRTGFPRALSFEVKSEVAGSSVTIKAGSFVQITRIS